MKRIKIKDARIRTYNNMFQEEPKTETFEEFWAGYLGRQHQSPTKKMDEHSCKENRRKRYEHTGIHDHCMKQSRNEGIGLLQELTGCRISGGKSIEVHGVQDVSINGQSNLMKEIPEWLTQGRTVLLPKQKI